MVNALAKNNQKQVAKTNPAVKNPDTNLGNCHLAVKHLFNAISTVKHTPLCCLSLYRVGLMLGLLRNMLL